MLEEFSYILKTKDGASHLFVMKKRNYFKIHSFFFVMKRISKNRCQQISLDWMIYIVISYE